MARGRHRVSPALHRRMIPLTTGAFAVAVAAGAWFAPAGPHGAVPPALTGLAGAGALVAAVLLRRWDRAAGKRVADLTTARTREEWRTEERIAELEADAEENRELRQRADAELRARRAELAKLRNDHAELLRRYALAETERARALESRRRLAIEAAAPARAIDPPGALTPEAFRRADEALRSLTRNATRQQALRAVEAARERRTEPAAHADADERPGRHAGGPPQDGRPHPEPPTPGGRPASRHHLVPAVASAVAPPPPARPASRAIGGFDFFGTHRTAEPAPATTPAVQPPAAPVSPVEHARAPRAEVIDLTAHDDTEQLDVRELRARS